MEHKQDAKPIDNLKDIPSDLNDEEQMDFLMEHGVSEEFLENVEEAQQEERPRPRTKPINVRFDDFTLGRLKDMAGRRNVGYQTLLKDFVVERLYQEELREGVLPASGREESVRTQNLAQPEEKQRVFRTRDWQAWAYSFALENEDLLTDPEVDSISLSRLAQNAASRLLEVSGEIKQAGAKQGFPATQLRRMVKGYERLKVLTERAIELYENKFGSEEPEGQADDPESVTRQVIQEAESILRRA